MQSTTSSLPSAGLGSRRKPVGEASRPQDGALTHVPLGLLEPGISTPRQHLPAEALNTGYRKMAAEGSVPMAERHSITNPGCVLTGGRR